MNTHSFLNRSSILVAALALTISVQAAVTDLATLPLSTYYAPSSVNVKPNILFVLDDSGSMHWDAMPDQAAWYVRLRLLSTKISSEQLQSGVGDRGMPPYMAATAPSTASPTTRPSVTCRRSSTTRPAPWIRRPILR